MASKSWVWFVVWFGVWFEELQHACGHKFCIRHFWKRSYIYTWNILTFHSIYYSDNDLLISALRVSFCASHKTLSLLVWNSFQTPSCLVCFLASKVCFSRRRAAFREPSFVGSARVMVACHDWGWGLGFTRSKTLRGLTAADHKIILQTKDKHQTPWPPLSWDEPRWW